MDKQWTLEELKKIKQAVDLGDGLKLEDIME